MHARPHLRGLWRAAAAVGSAPADAAREPGHPQRRGRSGGWQAAVRHDKAGYSTPSLVTRRRRRVTSFAFPFGGRANGRVYRQCRQRPKRTREPCRCVCAAGCATRTPTAARAASVRLPPAARSPAACTAAGCRPGVEAALPSRASVRREEARRGAGMGAGRARALRDPGGVAPPKSRLAVCVCLSNSYFAGPCPPAERPSPASY